MIALTALFIASLVCAIYTFLIYAEWFKNLSFFYIAITVLGIGMTIPWGIIVKYVPTKESLFLFSISWDVMVTLVSIIIPICFYGVKFSFTNWIGIGLILAGVFTIKLANIR